MKWSASRVTWGLLVIILGFWSPLRVPCMFLFPGCLLGAAVPLWSAPALSLLFWCGWLPLAGMVGLGVEAAGIIGFSLQGILLAAGVFALPNLLLRRGDWLPGALAVLLLALRLIPLFLVSGAPGAELTFHALVARLLMTSGGWPADLGFQAPGVAAVGFAPGTSFLAATLAKGYGGTGSLPWVLLLLVCLAQWVVDVGLISLAKAIAGPVAGGLAAILMALASPFPQDFAGWGGMGNLLALGAGLFLLSFLARGKRHWAWFVLCGGAAGAAHLMVAAFLVGGLLPYAAWRWRERLFSWSLLTIAVLLFSGLPLVLSRPVRVSPAESAAAISWARSSGPQELVGTPWSLCGPAWAVRKRIGGGVAGLAALGLFLLVWCKRWRLPGVAPVLTLGGVAWVFLTGLPAALFVPFGLFYPERVFLYFVPLILLGLAVFFLVLREWLAGPGRLRRLVEVVGALGLAIWALGALRTSYIDTYLGRIKGGCLLTPADQALLADLPGKVPESAVVATRHDDAGLWLPALTGRRATCCHTIPALAEEMGEAALATPPKFMFFGARRDRGLTAVWTTGSASRNGRPGRATLARRGRAVLYRITEKSRRRKR